MTTFSLHHGQLPIPFLRPKPTFFLCPSLIRNPFLSFHRTLPRRTGSPPVVSSLSRRFASEQEPPRIPIGYEDDEDDPFYELLGEPEPEDVSRKRSWTDRGWAPWEEVLTPEAEFARTSLDEGYEVPLTSPEAIEAFKMLTPSYRKKKIADIGEEEYINRLFAIKGEIPDKLKTIWAGPLALQLIPPRDWPPKGWEVDKEELEFIREAHKLQSVRVDVGGGGNWIGAPGFEESLMEVLKGGKEIIDAVFGVNKELGTKIKEWAKANPDRLKMVKEIIDAVFGGNKELGTKIKEWAKANPDRLKMDKEILDAVFVENKELGTKIKEWAKANPDRLNMDEETLDAVFGENKESETKFKEWAKANPDRFNMDEETLDAVFGENKELGAKFKEWAKATPDRLKMDEEILDAVFGENKELGTRIKEWAKANLDRLNMDEETLDAVFGENKESETKFKEWAKANPDRLKMDDETLDAVFGENKELGTKFKEWAKAISDRLKMDEEILDAVFGENKELGTKIKEWAKANLDRLNMDEETLDAVFGENKESETKFKEWAKANPDRLKMDDETLDAVFGENELGTKFKEWAKAISDRLKMDEEILDAVFGENKESETKFKEWAKANPDRLKMDDALLMMKDDILKHYKELVGSNRDEGPKGEGIGEVEKAVKGYLEFLEKLEGKANANTENAKQEETDIVNKMAFERYKVFIKQYTEWVDANRDKLEEESYKFDQDYYPGRRKRGKDYNEEMLELPFIYPGQIYQGKVTSISLYQGAFVDIGGVHDGWVPIKGNDWYWIRHHIKVGMPVLVEILAKRDPYRFRFPIEMRFVQPNIDHLIFNKFDFPPVFHRDEDTNPHERQRESGRELIPKRRPEVEEEIANLPLISDHPYVDELWHIHNAEQMILDHEEENPDEYKDKKFEETVDPSFDEENSVEYTKAYCKDALLPKMILNTNLNDLDMDAARAERQRNNRLQKQAEQRGEEFKISKLRRNLQMDEYDLLHWKRSLEEREALLRDISCRTAAGLPLEQPGKYNDDPKFWGDVYHKSNPLFQNKKLRDEENEIKKKKVEAEVKDQYKKILGDKASKWYEMSYDGLITRRALFEAQRKKRVERKKREERKKKEEKEGEELKSEGEEKEVDDYNDDIDFDYSIFGTPVASKSKSDPVVNGTNPPTVDDTSEE